MAGVIKEWKCSGHGYFESTAARCPKGCTSVTQVFLTPVGTRSDKTKHSDKTLAQLALDFGLSNIRGKSGETARVLNHAQIKARDAADQFRTRFGAMPKGGVKQALADNHAPATNAMAGLKEALPEFKRGTVITRDPDRESVKKVMAA